jgi:3-deoxy-D-manno-octulosonic acid kinase
VKESRAGTHEFLHDPALMESADVRQFDPAYWHSLGKFEGQARGRGSVAFVRGGSGGETWALRHYRRGGHVAKLVEDAYLWLGLAETRPWLEFWLTAELHAKGLPVPRPVAAHVERRGPIYRGDLITVRIPGAEPLADLLAAGALPAAQWSALGAVLRRFHQAGVRHDDINARNILRDAQGRFFLIDFDKARLLPAGPWQAQNLARFQRSLEKFKAAAPSFHFGTADWAALLSGYA